MEKEEQQRAIEIIKQYPNLQRRREELEDFLLELDKRSSLRVITYDGAGRREGAADPVGDRVIAIEGKGQKAREELRRIVAIAEPVRRLHEHLRLIAAEGSSRGKEYLHLFDLLLSGWNGRGKPPGMQMSAGTCRVRLAELCRKVLYVCGITTCNEE